MQFFTTILLSVLTLSSYVSALPSPVEMRTSGTVVLPAITALQNTVATLDVSVKSDLKLMTDAVAECDATPACQLELQAFLKLRAGVITKNLLDAGISLKAGVAKVGVCPTDSATLTLVAGTMASLETITDGVISTLASISASAKLNAGCQAFIKIPFSACVSACTPCATPLVGFAATVNLGVGAAIGLSAEAAVSVKASLNILLKAVAGLSTKLSIKLPSVSAGIGSSVCLGAKVYLPF